ncbi:MAG TPA: sigma 54-interacting transcriptional regulator [Pyrinomonadaceae bacterium]|nr:sigma 54-interacting transcriptional regulator [Pyrinomonadaceae bacterium]
MSQDNPSHHARLTTHSDATGAGALESQAPSVILWGRQCASSCAVNDALSDCGLTPRRIQDPSAAQGVEKDPRGHVALVALSADPSQFQTALDVIRALRRKGFQVVSYQEDGQSWPLGLQCRALLAGCSWLLDSAKAGFGEDLRRLLRQVSRAEAERAGEEERIKELMGAMGIVGESQTMLSVFRVVERLSALSDTPTLITGETGTGKELMARAIRRLDPKRRSGPILTLNCGAVSQGLAESELFGHRRGAFTGADRDRKGLFRAAEGGILFLDEVGELEGALQTKLLRAIQENRVLGVGEEQETPVNVRVVAATNRSLPEMVSEGKFREDLFHRLSALSVHIPPLRDRPADLQPLIQHFLQKYRPREEAAEPVAAGLDFVEALTRIKLPGNVRQLENLIRRALVNKVDGGPLNLSDLPPEVWQELSEREQGAHPSSAPADETADAVPSTQAQPDLYSTLARLLNQNGWNLSQSLDYCEKLIIKSALLLSNDNQSQTARLLGITSRSVYNKVRKHHLNFQ